jgi:hypothetical protein
MRLMIRLFALVALCILLTGCLGSPKTGPFAKKQGKQLPPPYGSPAPNAQTQVPTKPVGNQSPLGIASADPTPPLPPDEQPLIPPKIDNHLMPAGGPITGSDPGADGVPPFRRKTDPPTPPVQPKLPMMDPPIAPGAAPPVNKNLAELKALVSTASGVWRNVNTYETTVTRRELNPKGKIDSDVVLFQFRKEPLSIHTLTISEDGKGRELVYYPAKHGDNLYVKLGKGDPFPGSGFVAPPISPDDKLVKEKARYSIREAGFGTPISKLAGWVAALEAGKIPANALSFDGPVQRAEFTEPVVGVTHKLRPNDDPLMPAGGTRRYFFDMKRDSAGYGLPVLIIATEANGKEVEYYLFEKIKLSAALTDADFHPDRLKKKK